MEMFEIAAGLITLAALFSYVNERWCQLPTTVGLMLIALVWIGMAGAMAGGTQVQSASDSTGRRCEPSPGASLRQPH